MRGINKVTLVGFLGQDPELRETESGLVVCNLSVATSEFWVDRTSGENKEKTEWHRVVLFGKQATVAGEFLHKGSHVYIEGSLQTRKWQDKEGVTRYTTEIKAREMLMLGDNEAKKPTKTNAKQEDPEVDDFDDDDIPF